MIEDKNNLPELPKGWVWTRLGEICTIKYGKDLSVKEFTKEGYPVFGANGIIGFYTKYLYDEEQVLISCRGAYSGKINLSPPKSFITHNSLVLEISKPFKEIKRFLFYVLKSVDKSKLVTGTAQPQVTINNAMVLELPLPPLPEQHRIITKIEELFTKLDAGIDTLKKIKTQLKRYRQSVLKSAMEGKLTEKWREAHKHELEPASVLLERIEKERKKKVKGKYKELPPLDTSNLPELPEGWVWTRLGEIITFEYGKGLREDKRDQKGNVPVYGSNGIVGYHSVPLIEKPCLIVGRKGAAGYVHLSKVPCWPIDTTYYIIPPDELNLIFFYYLLSTLNLNSLDKSTAIPGLNRNDAYTLNIPLPPLPEQHKIVEEIEKRFTVADEVEKRVEQSLKQAERMRQSILKKAFEGKLVSQDPTDEPANVLLERIKKEKEKLEADKKQKGKVEG